MELIAEAIVYFLFAVPGAALRWVFSLKRKSFKYYLKGNIFINATIGGFFIALCVIIYIVFIKS
jgi:hypothetical protein